MTGKLIFNCALSVFVLLLLAIPLSAAPITGVTYTYDLSQPDPGTGTYTTFHSDPACQDPDNTKLTNGELGDDVTPSAGGAIFNNGTWVVVQNGGWGGAPQPKVDFVLPGTFNVASLEMTYLVEDPVGIYAPQPQAGINALTVSGPGFSAFANDFAPVYGSGGDAGTGVIQRRTALVDLGGVATSQLSIDVRTPYTFISLGEVIINEVPEPTSFVLLGLGALLLLYTARKRQA